MARPKFLNRTENNIYQKLSDIHQMLGDEKIQEICSRHLLEEREEVIIHNFLGRIKANNLVKNKDLILDDLKQESNNNPQEKERLDKIGRVIKDIAELFIYTEQLKQKISVVPERRLECSRV